MSSQNTIVERASAELTKRINGLRKHGNSNSNSINSNNSIVGKTSVMERVTNVLCGGSSGNVHNNNNNNNNTNSTPTVSNTPDKPYRYQNKHGSIFSQHGKLSGAAGQTLASNQNSNSNSNQSTPQSLRKYHPKTQSATKRFVPLATPILSIEQLFLDERFLQHFFLYFSSYERRELATVCTKWRDILYRNPIFFSGLVPVLQCREFRIASSHDKVKLYNSIIRRGFHSIALSGATDEDALDIVHSFALASKHVHSLSLRCSSISDRGLEALLDHLQVSIIDFIFSDGEN